MVVDIVCFFCYEYFYVIVLVLCSIGVSYSLWLKQLIVWCRFLLRLIVGCQLSFVVVIEMLGLCWCGLLIGSGWNMIFEVEFVIMRICFVSLIIVNLLGLLMLIGVLMLCGVFIRLKKLLIRLLMKQNECVCWLLLQILSVVLLSVVMMKFDMMWLLCGDMCGLQVLKMCVMCMLMLCEWQQLQYSVLVVCLFLLQYVCGLIVFMLL